MDEEKDTSEWITTHEAAAYLKLSPSRIYHLKNKLTHRKGNSRNSRVLFRKDSLLDDYMNI